MTRFSVEFEANGRLESLPFDYELTPGASAIYHERELLKRARTEVESFPRFRSARILTLRYADGRPFHTQSPPPFVRPIYDVTKEKQS